MNKYTEKQTVLCEYGKHTNTKTKKHRVNLTKVVLYHDRENGCFKE